MDCTSTRLLLNFVRTGELDRTEQQVLDSHLTGCSDCAALAQSENCLDDAVATTFERALAALARQGARIERIDSMSAHADSNEVLRWLHGFTRPPQQAFIVHGEPAAQDALGARIQKELGWAHKAPEHRETVQF